MFIYYGYTDASGEYYIRIDNEKCNGCGKCVEKCPAAVFEMGTVMIDLEDKPVAVVKEEFRKKIKYVCAACKQQDKLPCVLACKVNAVECT